MQRANSDSNRSLVANCLEHSILTGKRKPGERLLEIALARELGVSQGSVREALAELEMRGLVVKYPNRGTYVIELDAQGVRDSFQVRGELEPLACYLLAKSLTQETTDVLRNHLNTMRTAQEKGEYAVFHDAIFAFHRAIWSAQPNRQIERFLNMVCMPLFAYDLICRFGEPYANYGRLVRQHELLFTALMAGDGELASKLMRRFLRQWLREDIEDYARLSPPVPIATMPGAVECPVDTEPALEAVAK